MESQLAQVEGFGKGLGIAAHALSHYQEVGQLCKKQKHYFLGDV